MHGPGQYVYVRNTERTVSREYYLKAVSTSERTSVPMFAGFLYRTTYLERNSNTDFFKMYLQDSKQETSNNR